MTNTELVIETVKAHPNAQFNRHELLDDKSAKVLSPYFTYMVEAGVLTRTQRGIYIKALDFNSIPTATLVTKVLGAMNSRKAQLRGNGEGPKKHTSITPTDQAVEVDLFEVMDQVPIESIFDLLAAKFNVLQSQKLPMTYERDRLQDQLNIQIAKTHNLEAEVARLEEKQRVLNAENTRLTALMLNRREDRMVLAKPVNASGSVVFKEGEQRTVKVYRKVK